MMSFESRNKDVEISKMDFTEEHYRYLLNIAKVPYCFATYDSIPWGTHFILWRHDLDYSINRAARLATIEAEEGVTATYFVNPCSEYYNPFEKQQMHLIKFILSLGHHLGLHFDSDVHNIQNEEQLHKKVAQEGRWLEEAFGVRPTAFSFHNPREVNLRWDADFYGGLMNCYSRRFKSETPYISDSNGYWRFRRLQNVLTDATDSCLQVLTHPCWWQEEAMPPRQRVFRSIYGRATHNLRSYDLGLKLNNRQNLGGNAESLRFLEDRDHRLFVLCDYLWNAGYFQLLFMELWRLHSAQIIKVSKAQLRMHWKVADRDVSDFFQNPSITIDIFRLFKGIFGVEWHEPTNIDLTEYKRFSQLHNCLNQGRLFSESGPWEDGCMFLCSAIESMAIWGQDQSVNCDGLNNLELIDTSTKKLILDDDNNLEISENDTSTCSHNKWRQLKADLSKVSASGGNK
jgi:hypothetical protein